MMIEQPKCILCEVSFDRCLSETTGIACKACAKRIYDWMGIHFFQHEQDIADRMGWTFTLGSAGFGKTAEMLKQLCPQCGESHS